MFCYKTIISLYFDKVSMRQIATRLHCSRNTVSSVIKMCESLKLTPESISSLSEDALQKLLFPDKDALPLYAKPDFAHYHKELMRPGVTLSLLYEEYVMQCKSEHLPHYKRSYFFEMYKMYVKKNNLTMHINHKPADKVMVGWDGTTMHIINRYTGEISTVYLFVGSLPFSMLCYVQACLSMKMPDWIDCHIHMFEYFDGVPRLLIPDNLKTGVVSNKKFEDPILNKTYQEMADYYDITIIPTRVRKPKDKAAVEGNVGNITRAIVGKLRNREFFSLDELNDAIREELDIFNANPFQKRDGSRLSVYLEEEKEFMRPLPEVPFELSTWKIATVQMNYHVQVEKMNYSVPYEYVDKKVEVKLTKQSIDIFYKGNQIANHNRLYGRKNQYSTNENHMPTNHKLFEWNAERFLNWAKSIGPNTETVIHKMIQRYKHEEQSYKSCISILKLTDKYTADRLENACKLALAHISNPSYKNIRLILESGQDKIKHEDNNTETFNKENAHVRGADYYRS